MARGVSGGYAGYINVSSDLNGLSHTMWGWFRIDAQNPDFGPSVLMMHQDLSGSGPNYPLLRYMYWNAELQFLGLRRYTGDFAFGITAKAFSLSKWYFLATTWDSSSHTVDVFWGSEDEVVRSDVGGGSSVGTGSPVNPAGTGSAIYIGTNQGEIAPVGYLKGRMALVGFVTRVMSVDELERLRLGYRYVPQNQDAYLLWPLDSPTEELVEDLSGMGHDADATALLSVVEGPRIADQWGTDGIVALLGQPVTAPVLRATETDTARAFTRRKVLTIGQAQET